MYVCCVGMCNACVDEYACMQVCARGYLCMCFNSCKCVYIYIYMYICMYVCMGMYMYIYSIYVCVYLYTYVCGYTRMCLCVCMQSVYVYGCMFMCMVVCYSISDSLRRSELDNGRFEVVPILSLIQ